MESASKSANLPARSTEYEHGHRQSVLKTIFENFEIVSKTSLIA